MKSEILNLRLADNFRLREFLSRDAEHMGVDPMPTAGAVLEALKGTALLQGLHFGGAAGGEVGLPAAGL